MNPQDSITAIREYCISRIRFLKSIQFTGYASFIRPDRDANVEELEHIVKLCNGPKGRYENSSAEDTK